MEALVFGLGYLVGGVTGVLAYRRFLLRTLSDPDFWSDGE